MLKGAAADDDDEDGDCFDSPFNILDIVRLEECSIVVTTAPTTSPAGWLCPNLTSIPRITVET